MIAYIIVFTLVILITYGISRLSVDYSWYIAIAAGAVVNVIGLAVQASSVEGMNLMMVIVGSVLGGLLVRSFILWDVRWITEKKKCFSLKM